MLLTILYLHWFAALVTHLLIELQAAHLGERPFQGLVTAAFTRATLEKMP